MTREEAIITIMGAKRFTFDDIYLKAFDMAIEALEQSTIQEIKQDPKIGRCRECKYYEYDSVVRLGKMPLILAHEICSRWGNGCKTNDEGYCHLFEPKEGEEI